MEAAIEKSKGAIARLESVWVEQENYEEERENILARIVLGEATSAQLDELEKIALGNKGRWDKAEAEGAEARGTIAGLERSLPEAQRELASLINKSSGMVESFLLEEGERACAEYLEAADALFPKYLRVRAIGRLYERRFPGGRQTGGFRSNYEDNLQLPAFTLKACKGRELPNKKAGLIYEGAHASLSGPMDRATEEEKSRLEAMGVPL